MEIAQNGEWWKVERQLHKIELLMGWIVYKDDISANKWTKLVLKNSQHLTCRE